jgi:lipopolysaccharide cholinephosphotransferase
MPRSEYDRFIKLWKENPVEGYTLQNKDNSPAFMSSFTKIRKDHTTFLEHKEDIGRFHTGIFIDIFPLDRIPSAWLPKRLFYLRCMLYQLMVREYSPKESGLVMRLGSKLLLALIPEGERVAASRRILQKLTAYNGFSDMSIAGMETMRSVKVEYPATMFDSYTALPFEDGVYSVFGQWDENLRAKFGDYMQLQPEDDRTWTHHPVCIDFDRSAEEIFRS